MGNRKGIGKASPAFAKNNVRRDSGVCTGCGKKPCVCKNPGSARRDKELARVRAAMTSRDEAELAWTFEYCRTRRLSAAKTEKEFWRDLANRAELALFKLRSSRRQDS